MAYENILFELADGIATITMNRNDTRNALSWGMAADIGDALDRLGDARVLILTGAGKGFCSGGDMSAHTPEGLGFGDMLGNGLSTAVNPMLMKLHALDIPVIAAVNGAAAGAGAPLALSADFVIAGQSAFFYFAFPHVGLALDAGASWLMPRLVGLARASEALFLAERIPAAKAADWGMIHKAVADDALMDEARALAARLASGPTRSYALIRHALQRGASSGYAEALAHEAEAQRAAGNSRDCAEAVAAFLAKRAPVFEGR
ncbi:MAG: enoyl-CoA hydratase/isomerase family protein [Sphingomonadales bacterium]|nr:enoyl-CoA hydratase/isomerase family protein [Sphingomonadales bacterium]